MDKNKVNVPKIRFPGFTDPWEQRKFSDITYLAGEKNRNNIPYQSYSISNEKGFIPQDEQFENGGTMKEADKSMYLIVQPNSFAYNPARINVGSIGYYDLPENVIVSSLYEVFKTSDDIDDRFLWHWFKSDLFPKFIERYQEGGVRMYFYYNKLCMCSLDLPSIEEQRKIGKYFDKFDNLITLHQRKLNHLQDKKKGLLQKMFPKNGEKFPELRFPGFTDPWEQRKFEDIFKLSQGLQIPISKRFLTEGENKYFYITNEFLKSTCDEKYYIENPPESVICNQEDILMTRTGNTGIVVTDVEGCFHNNFFKIQYDKEVFDKHFIVQLLSTELMKRRILNSAGSSTIPDLSHKSFYKLDSIFPKIDEQKKISEFILGLDKTITLHQRKLNHLQQQKKGLLQQMFI